MLHSNNFWYSLPLRLNISRRESTFIQDLIRKRCGTAPVRCSPPAVSPYKYEIGAFCLWMKDKLSGWPHWVSFDHKQSLQIIGQKQKTTWILPTYIRHPHPCFPSFSVQKVLAEKLRQQEKSTAVRIFRDRKSDIVWHLTSKTGGRSPKAAAVAPLQHISRLKNRSQTSSWTEMPRMRKDTTEGQRPMIKMSSQGEREETDKRPADLAGRYWSREKSGNHGGLRSYSCAAWQKSVRCWGGDTVQAWVRGGAPITMETSRRKPRYSAEYSVLQALAHWR